MNGGATEISYISLQEPFVGTTCVKSSILRLRAGDKIPPWKKGGGNPSEHALASQINLL